MNIGAYKTNITISVDKAKTLYGIEDKDIKELDFNNDGNISIEELRRFGLTKYASLAKDFDKKVDGALLQPKKAEQKKQNAQKGINSSLFSNPFGQNNNFDKQKNLINRIA